MTELHLAAVSLSVALAFLLYNCGWAYSHVAKTRRRHGFLFALIFSLLPATGFIGAIIDGLTSGWGTQPMNAVYFVILSAIVGLSLLFYYVGLHRILKKAALISALRE